MGILAEDNGRLNQALSNARQENNTLHTNIPQLEQALRGQEASN